MKDDEVGFIGPMTQNAVLMFTNINIHGIACGNLEMCFLSAIYSAFLGKQMSLSYLVRMGTVKRRENIMRYRTQGSLKDRLYVLFEPSDLKRWPYDVSAFIS